MRILLIILGNVLMTSAYAFLTVPQKIINGGVTSFSLILSELTGIDTAVYANGITILFMLLCLLFLGKDYFLGSVLGGVCYMISFSFFHSMDLCLINGRPLAVAVAAVMVGTGYFLCISQHSTGVSFDTLALILNRKNPKINVAGAMFVINSVVLLLGFLHYGLQSVAFGLAFTAIQALTLNAWTKFWSRQQAGRVLRKNCPTSPRTSNTVSDLSPHPHTHSN